MLTSLIAILSNVFKYSSIDYSIPSALAYTDTSLEENELLNRPSTSVIKNTLAKFYFNADKSISPCSEIFNIIFLKTIVCTSCGLSSCSYEIFNELECNPPSYDSEKGITKLTLNAILDMEFSTLVVMKLCPCSSLVVGESIQHEVKYRILRCPKVLVSTSYYTNYLLLIPLMYFRQRIRVNRHIFLPFEKEEVYNQIKICFVDEFLDLGKYKFVPQTEQDDRTSLYSYDDNIKEVSSRYKLHSFIYHLSGPRKVTNSGHYRVVIRNPAYSNERNSSYVLLDDFHSYQISAKLAQNEIFNSGEAVSTRSNRMRKKLRENEEEPENVNF